MKLLIRHRDAIEKKVLDARVKPLREDYKKQEKKLLQQCFDSFYNPIMKKVKNVPVKYFEKVKDVSFSLDNGDLKFYFTLQSRLPRPHYLRDGWGSMRFDITKSNVWYKKLKDLNKIKEGIHVLEKDIKTELFKILAAASTFKRLFEIWPEANTYVTKGDFPVELALVPKSDKLNQYLKMAQVKAS